MVPPAAASAAAAAPHTHPYTPPQSSQPSSQHTQHTQHMQHDSAAQHSAACAASSSTARAGNCTDTGNNMRNGHSAEQGTATDACRTVPPAPSLQGSGAAAAPLVTELPINNGAPPKCVQQEKGESLRGSSELQDRGSSAAQGSGSGSASAAPSQAGAVKQQLAAVGRSGAAPRLPLVKMARPIREAADAVMADAGAVTKVGGYMLVWSVWGGHSSQWLCACLECVGGH